MRASYGRPAAAGYAGAVPNWDYSLGSAATGPQGAARRSLVHSGSLALVWLAIATSGVVFSEPAPVDALTMGLIILLPLVGLVRIDPAHVLYLAMWLIVAAGGLLSSAVAHDVTDATIFKLVSLYLYLASFVFAGLVAKAPMAHTRLILNAWTVAALVAGLAALIGYFSLLPGAYDLFTKFGRAAGTFKDPNVFGPFLVIPILYMLHLVLSRSLVSGLLPLAVAAVLVIAVLLSFSRGAWVNLALALAIFGYLRFVTSRSYFERERILALLALGVTMLAGVIIAAVQFDQVNDLLAERASLNQSYDVGPEGRFAGQRKAITIIAENPIGIGAKTFGEIHHHEGVHNVFLNMPLSAGWIGGGMYIVLVLVTLALGLRHCLRAHETQPLFVVLYASFVAVALEGLIIDTDHWRHFYLLMGMIWGLMVNPEVRSVGLASTTAAASRLAATSRGRGPRRA